MARTMLASFLVLMLAFPAALATDFTVGDSSGWTLGGPDYSTWAASQTFHVGDTLLFKYDSNHALDEVSESDYSSCSSSNSIKSYTDGNTKISLSSTGKRYFLCPKPAHCSGGMKLQVNVVAASGTPPTTPSGSPPTTPSTPSSPSGTPATNTTTPPPKPNGANTVSSAISLLVGSFFVSAIMFGFMG